MCLLINTGISDWRIVDKQRLDFLPHFIQELSCLRTHAIQDLSFLQVFDRPEQF